MQFPTPVRELKGAAQKSQQLAPRLGLLAAQGIPGAGMRSIQASRVCSLDFWAVLRGASWAETVTFTQVKGRPRKMQRKSGKEKQTGRAQDPHDLEVAVHSLETREVLENGVLVAVA